MVDELLSFSPLGVGATVGEAVDDYPHAGSQVFPFPLDVEAHGIGDDAQSEAMERTSMSNFSLARAPVSLAIQTDAMVAEVLRFATRKGGV